MSGFASIDALAALTILAFAGTAAAQAQATALRLAGGADEAQRAAVLARAMFAVPPTTPGSEGRADGFSWVVTLSEPAEDGANPRVCAAELRLRSDRGREHRYQTAVWCPGEGAR